MALLDIFVTPFVTPFFDDPDDQAAAVIHSASVEMGTVGFFTDQIPCDKFIIGGAQVDMVIRLARIYKVRIDRAQAIGLTSAILAVLAGPAIAAECANQVVKYIPGYGSLSNTAVAASITEAIGSICAECFKDGTWVNHIKK